MRIHFLARRWGKTHHTVFPLRVFTSQLKCAGLDVKIFHNQQAKYLEDCDLLIAVEGDFCRFFPESEWSERPEIGFVKSVRDTGHRIAWFDDSDSSGYLRSYLFPLADHYLKSQALRSRAAYTRESSTGILFHDFYARFFGNGEATRHSKGPVDVASAMNVLLAWNLGLSDWSLDLASNRLRREWFFWLPRPGYRHFPPVGPLRDRPVQINCRIGLPQNNFPVSDLRRKCRDLVETFARRPGIHAATAGFLTREAYFTELCHSQVCVSPFGHGEICYRDFECFAAGAVLLKQDMEHLETWPAYFEPNVTYVPFAWDFSDFEGKLLEILTHPAAFQPIASAGRERFLRHLSPEGGELFATHLKELCRAMYPGNHY